MLPTKMWLYRQLETRVSNSCRFYLRAIPFNSVQFWTILRNSAQFHVIPRNSVQFCAILCNSVQFRTIPHNTAKRNCDWKLYLKLLKGVFAKNERGYRLRAKNKHFWSLSNLSSISCVSKKKIIEND